MEPWHWIAACRRGMLRFSAPLLRLPTTDHGVDVQLAVCLPQPQLWLTMSNKSGRRDAWLELLQPLPSATLECSCFGVIREIVNLQESLKCNVVAFEQTFSKIWAKISVQPAGPTRYKREKTFTGHNFKGSLCSKTSLFEYFCATSTSRTLFIPYLAPFQ